MINEAKKPENYNKYLARLEKSGIKQLGSGVYARVFQHPYYRNVVVKMFGDNDTAYNLYLNWVGRNQNNKYVPKIIPTQDGKNRHVMKIQYEGKFQTLNFVFLKRYNKINKVQLQQFTQYIRNSAKTPLSNAQRGYLNRLVNAPSELNNLAQWMTIYDTTTDDDLKRLAKTILAYSRFMIDLHTDNMMWDRKLQCVIFTDPLTT